MANGTMATNQPGDFASLLSLFTGAFGGNQGSGPAAMADPWGPQRGQYQTQLNQFMADPSSVLKDPAFLAAQGVGAENISRQAGAAGMGASGNRLADLFSFGQSSALDFEKQRFGELEDLAGVKAGSPVAAAGYDFLGKQTQGTNLSTGLQGLLSMLGLGGSGGQGLAALLKMFTGGGGIGGPPGSDSTISPDWTSNTSDVPPATDWTVGFGGDSIGTNIPPVDDSWLTGLFGT
jgi:hypothetical protein